MGLDACESCRSLINALRANLWVTEKPVSCVLMNTIYNLRAIISPDTVITSSELWDNEKRGERS